MSQMEKNWRNFGRVGTVRNSLESEIKSKEKRVNSAGESMDKATLLLFR